MPMGTRFDVHTRRGATCADPTSFLQAHYAVFFPPGGDFGDGIYPRLSPTGMGYEVMALVALVGGVIVAGLPRDAQNAGLK